MRKLSDIARVLGLDQISVEDREIQSVANLEEARADDLSYINSDRFLDRFLASKAGGPFELTRSVLSTPWTSGHDGGGAFLLQRSAK